MPHQLTANSAPRAEPGAFDEHDDADALNTALAGPAGQAAVADLDNFARSGVTILTRPVDVVV